ncbi:hypothetical protein [Paenibacillus aceris]|uniref:Uncharacterized protein n=1 Tax=Paenibacillus aceris TaxID=869555 RepID=A0ABS4I7K9_9BACL|nr:hypothetical protein [Paenibacillus aceris]MBP1966818.1 hypothetical protein [Paenibacillus aceris]
MIYSATGVPPRRSCAVTMFFIVTGEKRPDCLAFFGMQRCFTSLQVLRRGVHVQ